MGLAEVCCWLQGLRRSSAGKSSRLDTLAAEGACAAAQPEASHRSACQGAARPPRLRESLQTLQPWATESRDPRRVPVASAHVLIKHFYGFFFFFPSDKKIIIQVLLKMLFALKLPLYSFFLVKKGTLRTNQAGKYSVSSRYVPFSTSSFFKHNYQKKKLLTWILPIKMNRKNKSKNLKTVFVLLQGTHRVFVPCLTASQQKWHLSEVFIWALASHIKTFILLTLL